MRPVVVVGDSMLDRDIDGSADRLCPDTPAPVLAERDSVTRPGGAALAAILARADGLPVVLLTAIPDDEAGRELAGALDAADIDVRNLGCEGPTPEKVRIRADGRTLVRIDRGGLRSHGHGPLQPDDVRMLDEARVVLVADYGRGVTALHDVRMALVRCRDRRQIVWDPHPRGPAPVPGTRVVTPNFAEAVAATPDVAEEGLGSLELRASLLQRRWGSAGIAVTLGAMGAFFSQGAGLPLMIPAAEAAEGDACGAGDRFSARLATNLARGALPSEAVIDAVRESGRFVAAGGVQRLACERGSDSAVTRERVASEVVAAARSDGASVVATGGCFDLLHAGHLSLLAAARQLGDCLVVLLNSDRSIRRLKGPGRPLVPEAERKQLVAALSCVDAVEVFDDDTPAQALDRLRPDVWVKGGDYAGVEIAEAGMVRAWGGRAVSVPYLDGHSTSSLLRRAVGRGSAT